MQSENVTKWRLNRLKQVMVMRKLLELSGISQKMEYKAQINKSQKHVSKVIDVLEHNYLNSFSVYLECEDVIT